jgi:hypothetical protein
LLLGIQKAQVFNFIFISLNRCSAFYVSKLEDVDGLCHLVDDEDEQTVGHGMDREDIYYIKEVGNLINISIGEFGLQQRAPRKKNIDPTENFILMNLSQIFCMITQNQIKICLQPQKKNETIFFSSRYQKFTF